MADNEVMFLILEEIKGLRSDLNKNPKEDNITICAKCDFLSTSKSLQHICMHSNSPITDYINGVKEVERINDGSCEYFHPKRLFK